MGGRRSGAKRPPRAVGRSAARLMAVQALYQIAIVEAPASRVVEEFLRHRLDVAKTDPDDDDAPLAAPDRVFFVRLVDGVSATADDLEHMIAAVLDEAWPLARVEPLLLQVLRCGAYELDAVTDVPVAVVIDEYINVAHAFYGGREPAFVNGVLDKLARTLRDDVTPSVGGADDDRAA